MQNSDGLCFLDPHGDSAKRLLASVPSDREKDVIFWDPRDIHHPFGLNPFYCADPTNELEVSLKTQSFIDSLASLKEFAEIFKTAPLMKDMLQQLATTFIVNQGHTLAETIRFLIDPDYRQQFYPALSGTYARFRRFWESEFDILSAHDQRGDYASSINKLRRFQSDPILYGIFGQPNNSIDFRRAMDEKQIIIVDPSADTQGFIGAFIVWELWQAARSRVDIAPSERSPFHLFSDEFQTYLTTAFPKLQAEARKYAVDTVVAHQVREQLDGELPELTRAVGNIIVFQVTHPNAMALAGEFDTTPPPGETRLEVLTEPVYENYMESGWTDRDAEAEYKRLGSELKTLYTQARVFCYFSGVVRLDEFERVAQPTDLPHKALYFIYEKFNPDFAEIEFQRIAPLRS